MPIRVFVLILFSSLFFATGVAAQTPTPVSVSPTAPSAQTCDLCGWCDKGNNPTPPPTWQQCKTCIYQDYDARVLKPNSYYSVFGCVSTKPEAFVKSILSIVFGIAGGIAFLSVLWGSVTVLTSSGDPAKLQNGKDLISSSLLGILLIIFSVFLLRVVGFDILRIPGFG